MGELYTYCSSLETIPSFSIHPRYKHDVAYRLSRAGLAVAYGQQIEFLGPIVRAVDYRTGDRTINITYGSVSSIEQRSSTGFDVSEIFFFLIYSTNRIFCFILDLLSWSCLFE